MNGLSLCAGIGALDLGLHLAVPGYRAVRYVEREAFAAAVLVARMEDSALDLAPIWDDLATFNGRDVGGCVDIVSSGLPCQPYSLAGKRKGHEDERALWPEFVRIVRECEPRIVFLENVPAFAKLFEPVWRELRGLGFEWAPPLLHTASESGAPHIRRRFFALAAHPERVDLRDESWWISGEDRPGQARPGDVSIDNPDSRESGLEGRGLPGCERADERATRAMGDAPPDADRQRFDADRQRFDGEWCGWVFDGERSTLRHDPDRCGHRCRIRGSLWDSESPPIRMAARTSDWVDRIRAIGNVGTPPVVYARAFLTLASRLSR